APADGLWPSSVQKLRSARENPQAFCGASVRGDRPQSVDRYCGRAGTNRAPGRLFHLAQVVSQRRFLFGDNLSGDGLPDDDVPGVVRDPAHVRMDGAMGRDGARYRTEDRAAAPDLYRRSDTPLRPDTVAAQADGARRCG